MGIRDTGLPLSMGALPCWNRKRINIYCWHKNIQKHTFILNIILFWSNNFPLKKVRRWCSLRFYNIWIDGLNKKGQNLCSRGVLTRVSHRQTNQYGYISETLVVRLFKTLCVDNVLSVWDTLNDCVIAGVSCLYLASFTCTRVLLKKKKLSKQTSLSRRGF